MFGEFPERYPFVDNYTVTCAANEALTFKVTKDTQHITPIADEFEQIRKADGGAYDYNLFTPADTSKPQPIVLVFHGFGDDENLYNNRLATAWADPANQAKRPAYVLAPMFGGYSMYSQSGRIPTYENVYKTVQQMIADGKVDPNRVYVTGKSYGGGAVYEFTERYPGFAAGAIAMCGQSTNPYSDVQSNLDKIVDLPLWIAHATEDPTVNISCSRDVYSKLVDLGSTVVKFTEYATDEMPAVAPDNKVIGPDLNGIESLHGVESVVLEDQAYMEWLFAQAKPVEPEYKPLTKPNNFKYIVSTRGDFVSKDNVWLEKYGNVMDHLKAVGSKNLANFSTYLDAPVVDKFTDMEGSSNDLGQWIINTGVASDSVEFTVRPGEFTDGFLTESVKRFTTRMTTGMLSGIASGTVSIARAALTADVEKAEVDYTVNIAKTLSQFSAVEEDVKVIISVVDIANNVTGPKELTSVSVDAKAAVGGTLSGKVEVDNLVNGASSSVQLSVEILGATVPLATTTLARIQDTVVDGDFQYIDLMGDWYFHFTGNKNGLEVENLLETAKNDNWPIVTPALTQWAKGFGDVTSQLGGDYFGYGIIGDGYYVREFDLPADFDAKDLVLSIGYMDDRGEAFINGTRVGATGMKDGTATGDTAWAIYSSYQVDPSILNVGGTNTIVVRCQNDGIGGGGWYGGPVALYSKLAFESDESTSSLFTEYSFESKYAASAQGKTGTVANKYLVYLPESYDENPDRYYPTVYLMHQYNSDHTSYIVDDVDTLINEAIKQAVLDDMIVVVPNSAESSWWRGDWMKMVSDELVPLIDSQYRTIKDARYRFTAGCSMGGQGAFGVALQNPDLFSGAISFFGAFSYGGNADPRAIAEKESVEYMKNYAMYFICGNQDIYQFGSDAIDLHQILLSKGVDHEFFIDNGEHNSVFYLPHFIEGFEYVRNNMYKSSAAVDSQLDADIKVEKNVVNVDFKAAKGIEKYFNLIPASSYTKDTTPDLAIPVRMEVEQDGKLVYAEDDRDFSISKSNRSELFRYDVSEYVTADEEYTVTFIASIFDRAVVLDKEVVNGLEVGSVELSATKLAYTGKARVPKVTVENENGKALKEGKDYEIVISNEDNKVVTSPTSVGKYTIKVSFLGKYADTKAMKLKYTIVPAAVKNMKANLAKYNSVKVSWTKSTGATSYYVYYKKSTASKYSNYKKVTGTSATISGLAAGTKYNFKVVPVYEDVKSTVSTIKTVTTLKKVTNVKVVRNGKKVTVSWKNIAGETGYQISRAAKKNGTANLKAYDGAAKVKQNITLSKANKFYYKVRAYKTVDGKKVFGPWSAVVYK